MKRDIYKEIFKRLLEIIPNLKNMSIGDCGKSRIAGFMDLNFDVLFKSNKGMVIALSQYYKQNEDLVPDPDMEIKIDFEKGTAEALTYQDIYIFQRVYPEPGRVNLKAKKKLNDFLYYWLVNLLKQGHKIKEKQIV